MTLSLISYEHEIEGRYLDEVTMKFCDHVPSEGTVPLDRISPEVLASLRAHIKGSTDAPIAFMVTGFVGDYYAPWLTIEITMHRMAPGSAQRLDGKTLAQQGWIQEIADHLAVSV